MKKNNYYERVIKPKKAGVKKDIVVFSRSMNNPQYISCFVGSCSYSLAPFRIDKNGNMVKNLK